MTIQFDTNGKRAWAVPTAEVFASQCDIESGAIDLDEDFTGTPS